MGDAINRIYRAINISPENLGLGLGLVLSGRFRLVTTGSAEILIFAPATAKEDLEDIFTEALVASDPIIFLALSLEHLRRGDEVRRLGRAAGYRIVEGVLNAADFGVPQRRLDLFLVGNRAGPPLFPAATHAEPKSATQGLRPWRTVRSAIGDLPDPFSADQAARLGPPADIHFIPPQWARLSLGAVRDQRRFGWLRWDVPADRVGPAPLGHPALERPITLREAARLQTFPDDFRFAGTAEGIAAQIGSSLPPLLALRFADAAAGMLDRIHPEIPGADEVREAAIHYQQA